MSALSRPLALSCALLLGVGSFGTWSSSHLNPLPAHWSVSVSLHSMRGIEHWEGVGWMTLLLAVVVAFALVFGITRGSSAVSVIIASLFGAALIISGVWILGYLVWFSPPAFTYSIGWGLWLCFCASLAGLALGSAWAHSEFAGRDPSSGADAADHSSNPL